MPGCSARVHRLGSDWLCAARSAPLGQNKTPLLQRKQRVQADADDLEHRATPFAPPAPVVPNRSPVASSCLSCC